jgi:type II secretory pathway component PulF
MLGIVLPEQHTLTDGPGPIKSWVLVLSTFLVAWSLVVYGIIIVAAPSFGELYAGFGARLPVLTNAVIDYSKYTVVLAFIGVVPLVSMWRNRSLRTYTERREFRWIITSFGISLIVGSITTAGLYLPIFKMGAAAS